MTLIHFVSHTNIMKSAFVLEKKNCYYHKSRQESHRQQKTPPLTKDDAYRV